MTELHDKIKRIRQLDKDLIPEAKEDKQRFLDIATVCTVQSNGSEIQHTTSGNTKEKAMIEYTSVSVKLELLENESKNLKLEVQKEIDSITDDKQRRFAKLYYIDQLNQKDISKKVAYEYGTVRNNLTDARKTLKLVTPSDTNCYWGNGFKLI